MSIGNNFANRQVCDVDIRVLKTMAPFLKFDTANTTGVSISSDSVYAMAKGTRRIAFQNPLEGTMTIEAQVYPFKFFAMLSDGVIDDEAIYADSQTITCATAGELSLTVPTNGTIQAGTVFAYPEGEFGDEGSVIAGTFASSKFTATTASQIAVGEKYIVGYVVSRTSTEGNAVKSVTFNNKRLPKDFYITMKTLDKDEDGVLTPFLITVYKATIQRNFELSFSSEGDPASVTLTFDTLENKDGNVMSFVELTGDAV
jgi:hypothetical protein